MDRSLWLLLRLRVVAMLRLWGRGLKTPKGLLLALLGACVFVPMALPFFFVPRVFVAAQVEVTRRYGPLALFVYCVLNVLLATGEHALHYSPGEVHFLFCGPYRPRQILFYKVAGGAGATLLTAFFLTFAVAHHTWSFSAAFLGLFLALLAMYLLSLAVGLTLSTLNELTTSRGRWVVLAAVVALGVVSFRSAGLRTVAVPNWEEIRRAIDSPAMAVALAPFRPFVMAFTAERIWPDLLAWSAVGGLIDLALLTLVVGLNSSFLEAAAAASARVHARLQRMRRGHVGAVASRRIAALPMFPWWAGLGPNLWRQLTTASRTPQHLISVSLLLLTPLLTLILIQRTTKEPVAILVVLPTFVMMVIFAQSVVAFDFRLDRPRMETLKTLPIRPIPLALGQMLSPILILSLCEWLALGLFGVFSPGDLAILAAAAVVIVPMNVLTVAIENLFFLWYPHRVAAVNAVDLPAIGRQLLVVTAKLIIIGVAGAVASGFGALVYLVAGGNWPATVMTAAVVLGACGLGLVPAVAQAFERFDVARDVAD